MFSYSLPLAMIVWVALVVGLHGGLCLVHSTSERIHLHRPDSFISTGAAVKLSAQKGLFLGTRHLQQSSSTCFMSRLPDSYEVDSGSLTLPVPINGSRICYATQFSFRVTDQFVSTTNETSIQQISSYYGTLVMFYPVANCSEFYKSTIAEALIVQLLQAGLRTTANKPYTTLVVSPADVCVDTEFDCPTANNCAGCSATCHTSACALPWYLQSSTISTSGLTFGENACCQFDNCTTGDPAFASCTYTCTIATSVHTSGMAVLHESHTSTVSSRSSTDCTYAHQGYGLIVCTAGLRVCLSCMLAAINSGTPPVLAPPHPPPPPPSPMPPPVVAQPPSPAAPQTPSPMASPAPLPLAPPLQSQPSSSPLNSGAIAAIATAAVVSAAAVMAVAVLAVRRCSHRKHGQTFESRPHVVVADSNISADGFAGMVAKSAAPKVAGLPQGELFLLTTACNYTWSSTAALPALHGLQAIEAGINDTHLDALLNEQPSRSIVPGTGMNCPSVQLSQRELQEQVHLLSDGLLGRGATALVFKCVWPSRFGPHALLAAKVMQNGYEPDIAMLSTFSYEANLLAGLRHPNVVKLYGYCLEPPTVCLILELLPCSLKELLYSIPSLPSAAASGGKPTYPVPSQASPTLSENVTADALHSSSLPQVLHSTNTMSGAVGAVAPGSNLTSRAPSHSSPSPSQYATAASALHSSSLMQGPNSPNTGRGGQSVPYDALVRSHGAPSSDSTKAHAARPVALPDMVRISTDTAAGLAYLHGQQLPSAASACEHGSRLQHTQYSRDGRIVHRDLKPANILLNSLGFAKISDFGLARQHDHTTFATMHLGAGTLPYMAPELLMSSQAGVAGPVCTNRVDIYSLGMIMWELLAGQQPWHGMAPTSIIAAVMNRRRLPLPGAGAAGHQDDREHAVVDVAWQHGSLPAHSHPDLPKFCNIIQACWQQRELRRPTAAALHGMLVALLQELEQ